MNFSSIYKCSLIICNLKLIETYLDSIKIFQFLKYSNLNKKKK